MRSMATPAAHRLMLEGAIELAEVEANGICIDVDRLSENKTAVTDRMTKVGDKLRNGKFWGLMRDRFGQKAKITAGDQVGAVAFSPVEDGGLGYINNRRTKTGQMAVDEKAFAPLLHEVPWLRGWLLLQKLVRISSTYLKGIERETHLSMDRVTGKRMHLLRPFFNLHTTDTYRSSCNSPNIQNMPIRNPKWAEMIRSCIVPRAGHRLVEIDFSGAEVRVAACYHQDPTMLHYLSGGGDMHWDAAERCFLAPRELLTKDCRGAVKGSFVFAEFYGDYWKSVAHNLWDTLMVDGLRMADGTAVHEHLAANGIYGLGDAEEDEEPREGTFQYHIKEEERFFWQERFPVYDAWRQQYYYDYRDAGEFVTNTGFHLWQPMRRNAVINNPVQGASFHCLLWCLIQLNREMRSAGIRGCIVSQIHDSIVADIHEADIPRYLSLAKRIITKDLQKQYPWLVTGMIAEAKISERRDRGGSWFRMTDQAL